jgi:hypothetical protein
MWVKTDDYFTTGGKIIICLACSKNIGCSMKLQLEQYVRSELHTKNKQMSSSKKQVLLIQMQQPSTSRNEFFNDMCNWMVSVNISWFTRISVLFGKVLHATYSRQVNTSKTLSAYLL